MCALAGGYRCTGTYWMCVVVEVVVVGMHVRAPVCVNVWDRLHACARVCERAGAAC